MEKQSFFRWMFSESDGSFSWRKGLAFLAGIAFLECITAFIVLQITIPKIYWVTINGVFLFYFFKDAPRAIGKKKNDNSLE